LSGLALASRLPSELNAMLKTRLVWPWSLRITLARSRV
jgi:hypothetical protein